MEGTFLRKKGPWNFEQSSYVVEGKPTLNLFLDLREGSACDQESKNKLKGIPYPNTYFVYRDLFQISNMAFSLFIHIN